MNDHTYATDRAVGFLRQVAELIAVDNLPAPISVTVYKPEVLVSEADLPVWCRALGVTTPDFVVSKHNDRVEFADVDVAGFRLTACHQVADVAVAS